MGCCCSCCINTYLNTFHHHAEILRGWTYRSCQRLIWFYLGRCTFVRRLLVYIGLWQTLGCVANLALSGCVVPAWHTVYSSGKYEVSHGLSSLLGFGEMRCVACLWGMVPRGSSYFSSEHTVYPPAGGYRVLSLLLPCGRCENGVNYTLMSNAGCVAAAQNIQWTIV